MAYTSLGRHDISRANILQIRVAAPIG